MEYPTDGDMEVFGIDFFLFFKGLVQMTDDGSTDNIIFFPQQLNQPFFNPHLDELIIDLHLIPFLPF